jgi:ABC-2 type transport system permease protein
MKRILQQIGRDKRTLGLLLFAPILLLTMLYLVFEGEDYKPKMGLVHVPEALEKKMDLAEAEVSFFDDRDKADAKLISQELDGYIFFDGGAISVYLEGSDPLVNGEAIRWVQKALKPLQTSGAPSQEMKIHYLHGSADMGQFDYFGPVLLGFFVFFFVFLIAGVSFIRERTRGTLERLLASPLRKWEIVVGYVAGFGIFTIFQATLIAAYSIYVLGMLMEGSFWNVLLIILLLSFTALTLGILLSSFANNELQMIQFIPIVIVPQIFFSGLFNLETISGWLNWIGPLTPLYYAADALRNVMVRGYGLGEIYLDILVLLGFALLFMVLNIMALRKYRKL